MTSFAVDALLGILVIGSSAGAMIAVEIWARTWLARSAGVFYPVVAVLTGVILFGLIAALLLRVLRRLLPLTEGEHAMRSAAFTRWKVDFNLQEAAFRALGPFVPVFGRAWLFRLLGARIASPTLIAGLLTDPAMTRIGRRTIVGGGASITCHLLTEGRFVLKGVVVGNGVTIGGGSIVMAGVVIGDGAILSPGSVALPDTRIPARELWAGNPARKMSSLAPPASPNQD